MDIPRAQAGHREDDFRASGSGTLQADKLAYLASLSAGCTYCQGHYGMVPFQALWIEEVVGCRAVARKKGILRPLLVIG